MHRPVNPKHIEVVDDAIAEILRRKEPQDRVAMAMAANRTMRILMGSGLREQHPEWSETQIQKEITRRMLLGAA